MKETDRTIEKAPNAPIREQEEQKIQEILAALPEIPLVDGSVPIPSRKTISDAIKDAEKARRGFESARSSQEEERKKLAEERNKLHEEKQRYEQLPRREQELLARERKIEQQEENARGGFHKEREEILGHTAREREQVRKERSEAELELSRWRSEQEQKWRAEQDERRMRWHREEEERARCLEEQSAQQKKELQGRRQEAIASLEKELSKEREVHEQKQKQREEELARREEKLQQEERDQKLLRRKDQADREILEEDRKALEEKIKRRTEEQVSNERRELCRLQGELLQARNERDEAHLRIRQHREIERLFEGASPQEILARLAALQRTNEELRNQLSERPTLQERHQLRALERERDSWREERAGLEARRCELEARLSRYLVSSHQLESLRGEKEALEAQRKLLTQALDELKNLVDQYTQRAGQKHPLEALVALDDDEKCKKAVLTATSVPEAPSSLKALVLELQQRIFHDSAAGSQGKSRNLFYPERDLRCFLAGMAQSHLSLLQGISGTGKTSLPLGVARALGAEKEVVAVQAGWRDRQDLLGHYNVLHGKYHATNFLQALYLAHTQSCADRPFFIVLDEINLSRVEQFFADLLSALEQPPGEQRLTILGEPIPFPPTHFTEGRHLHLPPNVWFVGTANHDESTIEFADKTYDRAHIMELERATPPAQSPSSLGVRKPISLRWLESKFEEAQQQQATQANTCKMWLRSARPLQELEHAFGIRWGNRFERDLDRFIPVLIAAGGTEAEGLDHLLVTKVLRKLRGRHDVLPSQLESLHKLFLEDATLGSKLPGCHRFLEHEIASRGGEVIL